VCEFKGLAAGAYAATVFTTKRQRRLRRRFGSPLEGYGFTTCISDAQGAIFRSVRGSISGKGVLALSIT